MGPQEIFLRELFDAAVAASSPSQCLAIALPDLPLGRTVVIGAGKAAASMALAVEEHWDRPLEGLVVTRYGHAVKTASIEVIEAAHPVPDAAGLEAAARILDLASNLGENDLALCLISGGGSALLAAPAGKVSFAEKQDLTRLLLRCGASVGEINMVRKQLSAIKGGRLAEACHPARVITLAISDVAGDDPSIIASGPTVPDRSTPEDAVGVLNKYSIAAPISVLEYLSLKTDGSIGSDDDAFLRDEFHIVGKAQTALEAAASVVANAGYRPWILSDRLQGEAREVAKDLAQVALNIRREALPGSPPCCLLSGGETTVTVTGHGRGGRNTEFLLALSIALEGEKGVWALAADTDGIDGVGDNAGAAISPDTLSRARQAGLDPEAALADNDAYEVFRRIGDLVITGPTRTNVNDFRAILIEGQD